MQDLPRHQINVVQFASRSPSTEDYRCLSLNWRAVANRDSTKLVKKIFEPASHERLEAAPSEHPISVHSSPNLRDVSKPFRIGSADPPNEFIEIEFSELHIPQVWRSE